MTAATERELIEFVAGQRWYASKTRAPTHAEIVDRAEQMLHFERVAIRQRRVNIRWPRDPRGQSEERGLPGSRFDPVHSSRLSHGHTERRWESATIRIAKDRATGNCDCYPLVAGI